MRWEVDLLGVDLVRADFVGVDFMGVDLMGRINITTYKMLTCFKKMFTKHLHTSVQVLPSLFNAECLHHSTSANAVS